MEIWFIKFVYSYFFLDCFGLGCCLIFFICWVVCVKKFLLGFCWLVFKLFEDNLRLKGF